MIVNSKKGRWNSF